MPLHPLPRPPCRQNMHAPAAGVLTGGSLATMRFFKLGAGTCLSSPVSGALLPPSAPGGATPSAGLGPWIVGWTRVRQIPHPSPCPRRSTGPQHQRTSVVLIAGPAWGLANSGLRSCLLAIFSWTCTGGSTASPSSPFHTRPTRVCVRRTDEPESYLESWCRFFLVRGVIAGLLGDSLYSRTGLLSHCRPMADRGRFVVASFRRRFLQSEHHETYACNLSTF